ncbi:hypothetical protein INR49_019595 [Caranx melampygus]|nr:hypothetical protein INR49_019595 [Caranx melampygus]
MADHQTRFTRLEKKMTPVGYFPPSFLMQVVMLGSSAVVAALLEVGANPDRLDPVCSLTVTHDAAREGFVDTVRVLMEHGANINLLDKQGNLPLHLAAREGHLQVVQLLIGHTENPRAPNSQGFTAGELAHLHGKMETASYIRQYLSSSELEVKDEEEDLPFSVLDSCLSETFLSF